MDKSQITSSIPAPMAKGVASDEFGRPWSVYRCLPGRAANVGGIADLVQFGADLANFLTALERIDTTNGPVAGPHSHFSGGLLTAYDADTRQCIRELGPVIDAKSVLDVWDRAIATVGSRRGVGSWRHGSLKSFGG